MRGKWCLGAGVLCAGRDSAIELRPADRRKRPPEVARESKLRSSNPPTWARIRFCTAPLVTALRSVPADAPHHWRRRGCAARPAWGGRCGPRVDRSALGRGPADCCRWFRTRSRRAIGRPLRRRSRRRTAPAPVVGRTPVRSCQLHAVRKKTSSCSTCSPALGTRSPVHGACVIPNSQGAWCLVDVSDSATTGRSSCR